MVDLSSKARLDRAIELMYFGFKRLVQEPDRVLARRGLSRVHHRLLYFIARRPGLSVGELLRALEVSKQAVNLPLRTLLRQGLARSEADRRDGRIRRLRLTARGAALEATLSGLQHAHLTRVFAAAGKTAERGWREVMAGMGGR